MIEENLLLGFVGFVDFLARKLIFTALIGSICRFNHFLSYLVSFY